MVVAIIILVIIVLVAIGDQLHKQVDVLMVTRKGEYKGGKAFQLLESIYIVETTKNYEPLTGRMKFIAKMYAKFIPVSKASRYKEQMTKVYERYKVMYPDRELTESQIALSMCPSVDGMRLFYADSVVRFYESKAAEMYAMKTKAAKERRRQDMIVKEDLVVKLFEIYQLPDNGHLDRIEQILQNVQE